LLFRDVINSCYNIYTDELSELCVLSFNSAYAIRLLKLVRLNEDFINFLSMFIIVIHSKKLGDKDNSCTLIGIFFTSYLPFCANILTSIVPLNCLTVNRIDYDTMKGQLCFVKRPLFVSENKL